MPIEKHQASVSNLVFYYFNLYYVGRVLLAGRGLECQDGTIVVSAGKVNARVPFVRRI